MKARTKIRSGSAMYISQPGETLYSIAQKVFGGERYGKYWDLIYKANPEKLLPDPNDIIPPNTRLIIC